MGEVYRADDLELGQSVALKFLPERVAGDPIALDRFRGEVRTARQVAHPNVCRIYDIAEVDGHVFLSMEYIDGEDLARVLRRLGRPSREKAIEIARQICLGLAAAHENNVLHRDLKPANIMIDGRGRVRITDFGLAGLADKLEHSESRAGTPAYMAPEQLAHGKVSARSDIYSLGLILYELFTGKGVFDTSDVEELKRKHASGTVSARSSISEEIDPAVERVVMRCLESQPKERPQSVYQVLAALPGGDPLAAAVAAGETPSPELVANARDAGGLRPATAIGLVVAMLAFLVVTYVFQVRRTVMPEQSPAVLSVVAGQIMNELGYDNLPSNTVKGYEGNPALSVKHRTKRMTRDELAELSYPPRFFFWQRWTDGEFIPANFHFPEGFEKDGPIRRHSFDALVTLDSTGRLVALQIEAPPRKASPNEITEVDWSPLLRRLHVTESDASLVPAAKTPSVVTDRLVAWRIDGAGPYEDGTIIQAGMLGNRINYCEVIPPDQSQSANGRSSTIQSINETIDTVFVCLLVFLAWRNLQASRGDSRNAFRCALVIGALYGAMEVLAMGLGDVPILGHLRALRGGRAGGHVVLHALLVWVIYMAVEPYVRRTWPRLLVGSLRLLDGRIRDPAVGCECLFGVVGGVSIVAILALTTLANGYVSDHGTGRLISDWELQSMISPGRHVVNGMHFAAWAVLDAAYIAGYLMIIRFLTRNALVSTLLAIVFIGSWGVQAVVVSYGVGPMWLALLYGLASGTILVLLVTRVGILAGGVAMFVLRASAIHTLDLDAWYAPYAIVPLAAVLVLATYGFWVSLAGHPIFKDMLAEPKATS